MQDRLSKESNSGAESIDKATIPRDQKMSNVFETHRLAQNDGLKGNESDSEAVKNSDGDEIESIKIEDQLDEHEIAVMQKAMVKRKFLPGFIEIKEVETRGSFQGNPKFSSRLQNKYYFPQQKKWVFIDERGELFTYYPEEKRIENANYKLEH